MRTLFTIGYSGFTPEAIVVALKENGVNCIVDVRSMPMSKFHPEYNKPELSIFLRERGILYRHFPDEFGARQEASRFLMPSGQLNFELFSKSEAFLSGVEKVVQDSEKGLAIALMCAEKDPAICHRTILVGRYFHEAGWRVIHITPNDLESQESVEQRLLNMYFPHREQLSLLEASQPEEELIRRAYRKQNEQIGYRKDD